MVRAQFLSLFSVLGACSGDGVLAPKHAPSSDAVPPGAEAGLVADAVPSDDRRDTLGPEGAFPADATADGRGGQGDAAPDAAVGSDVPVAPPPPPDAASPTPCTTTIVYGAAWIRPAGVAGDRDVVPGVVTWDGTCTPDAAGNAFAVLSNGWQPFFEGEGACRIALDVHGGCPEARAPCATRIAYGPAWEPPDGHPERFDDVPGRVFPAGECFDDGGLRAEPLSNGWVPHYAGPCQTSVRYTQCGGLYANPVVGRDCADPGVLRDGDTYVLACTSGNAPAAFPLFTSPDLVHWTPAGAVFPAGARPAWAVSDFWAPEIHRIGDAYVAYFSARTAAGNLALGAARGPTATGPFGDPGHPLLSDPGMGLIDASAFVDAAGQPFLVWKEDGNAIGRPTPIHVQALTADGLGMQGAPTPAIVNDRGWEGDLVEGPYVIGRNGAYYLFYSGNAYYDARYALGVARAPSPQGPWEKRGPPILGSNGAWEGPGHASVVTGPGGDDVVVYHAWTGGHAGGPPGRLTLIDAVRWVDGWPTVPGAPSSDSRPCP